jgi:Putative Flp pilus-assembly TadE/G-like
VKRLREARGQTLVFFVVLMGGLILLLAFVLNVGAVASAQRQVQSLADGAALTAVQKLPFDPSQAESTAGGYGSCPSDCQIDVSPDSTTISIQASRQVSGLLLPLVTTPTARATASARIEPAQSLTNQALRSVSSPIPKPYLVPLVLSDSTASCVPSCFNFNQTFSLGSGAFLGRGDFGFLCESSSCASGRGSGGRNALARQIECQSCLGDTYSTPSDVRAAATTTMTGSQIGSALRSIVGQTVIVPIFDSSGGGTYGISGFGAFVITDVPFWDPLNGHQIRGHFVPYTAPEHLADPNAQIPPTNYGVSVIGLTQ